MLNDDYFSMFNKLYDNGAIVRFVNEVTRKTKTYKYKYNNNFKRIFLINSKINNINSYIEKYPNEDHINKIILDFDGDNKYDVSQEVLRCCTNLHNYGISYFVEDSTNKGYHLFIFLGKHYNFRLSNNFNINNKFFKLFIKELLGNDYDFIDGVNIGLRTNIRMLGSIHPKTSKMVKKVDYYVNPKYYNNDGVFNIDYEHNYISTCYDKCKDMVEEIKYNGRWRKTVNYDDDYIDLRTLPWDNIKHTDNNSLWCSCPWHNDSNPSLRVYEKVCYCMCCGKISFDKIKDYFNL